MCHHWGSAQAHVSFAGAAARAQIATPVFFAVAMVRPSARTSTFAVDLMSDQASFQNVSYCSPQSNSAARNSDDALAMALAAPVLAVVYLDLRFEGPHPGTALVCLAFPSLRNFLIFKFDL